MVIKWVVMVLALIVVPLGIITILFVSSDHPSTPAPVQQIQHQLDPSPYLPAPPENDPSAPPQNSSTSPGTGGMGIVA